VGCHTIPVGEGFIVDVGFGVGGNWVVGRADGAWVVKIPVQLAISRKTTILTPRSIVECLTI